jgi:hypothetical protein
MKHRKKRQDFTLQGRTAKASEWAKALGSTECTFRDAVYAAEKRGATREQAMLATIRHLSNPNRTYRGLWEKLAEIMERDTKAAK